MQKTALPVRLLQEQLRAAQAYTKAVQKHHAGGTLIEVPGTGHALAAAYEQLRNVAEYTEEHLLLQRAIRRFYRRNVNFYTVQHRAKIGEELITELTLANYMRSGTYGSTAAEAIDKLMTFHLRTYKRLVKARVPRDTATNWVLDLLSVETEGLLNPHSQLDAQANFAYDHYLRLLARQAYIETKKEAEVYEICLYIAVHQALLKSDLAIVRHDLVRIYRQDSQDIRAYIRFNQMVTHLFTAPLTQRIKRAVGRQAAALRILKNLTDARPDVPEMLDERQTFLHAFDMQTRLEYRQAKSRLNKGLARSIAFVFITKVLVGVALEIPYDLITTGSVGIVPLLINILFPPLYMASLKLGLKPPSSANAAAVHFYIDKALYTDESPLAGRLRIGPRHVTVLSRILYGIIFPVPFMIILSGLSLLHFNWLQMVIFFVFLSTASFLGFRLSHIVSELELVTKQSGFMASIRDFFYLPFIVAGQWVSGKYAQINVVANFLDMAIDLPLKTVLRLARQWTRFVNEKREQL